MKRLLFLLPLFVFILPFLGCGGIGSTPSVITVIVPVTQEPLPQLIEPTQQPVEPLIVTVVVPATQQEKSLQPVEPTQTSQPPQQAKTYFTANRDLSCAEGPSWYKYWFLDKFPEGETAEVLGVNGDYYLLIFKNQRCWVLGKEGVVTGDTLSLPFVEAPPLPRIEVTLTNGFPFWGYFIFYDWESGQRVKAVGIDPGKSVKFKIPSGYYNVWVYDKGDANVFQIMINFAVGDGNHWPGLKNGVFITIP